MRGIGIVAAALVGLSPFTANAAGTIEGGGQQALNIEAVAMFLLFVVATLGITKWAANRTRSAADFYAAGGGITGLQNGLAIAGDFMSAASFLGISALVFQSGFDGLIYSVGWLVGWPIVLFLIAERLRNLGRFTFADVAAFRLAARPVRILSATGTLTVVAFYLIAQMVGAGKLIELLFGLPYLYAEILVGALMITYVAAGGMVATTWVQIIKACLLLGGASFIAFMVLSHFDFSLEAMFRTATEVHPGGGSILAPGKLVTDPISAVSLGMALMFGTAGLPHILMRFFTVPDAKAARKSVLYATGFIGYFYILTFIIGFGAITLLMNDPAYFKLGEGGTYDKVTGLLGGANMAAVHLSKAVGGSLVPRVHFGGGVRDHIGRRRRADARGRFRHQPRSLCFTRTQQGVRAHGSATVEDCRRRDRHRGHHARLRFRKTERGVHGGPRVRRGRELQFPGAAHERFLARDDDAGRGSGRLPRTCIGRGHGHPEPGGVGEDVRLRGRDIPLRQSGAVLDDARVPRHLDRLASRQQRARRGREGGLRGAVRARRDRHRGGGSERALDCPPSPHHLRWGECRGEGQPLALRRVSAPHPSPLPAGGERERT